jgi:hypothetical protein
VEWGTASVYDLPSWCANSSHRYACSQRCQTSVDLAGDRQRVWVSIDAGAGVRSIVSAVRLRFRGWVMERWAYMICSFGRTCSNVLSGVAWNWVVPGKICVVVGVARCLRAIFRAKKVSCALRVGNGLVSSSPPQPFAPMLATIRPLHRFFCLHGFGWFRRCSFNRSIESQQFEISILVDMEIVFALLMHGKNLRAPHATSNR